MNKIIKKSPVVIHQLFFLFAQLTILQLYGIGYSGTLAYVGAVSTFLAVLINLRWDIEIMVSNNTILHESLFDSSITIFLMTIIVSCLNLVFGSPLPIYIIFSAFFIAIHELLVSILFVQNKIYTYSFFRAIPAMALILFALIGFQAEIIWPTSFLVSVFFLIIYLNALFVRAITELSIKRIKKIKFLQKFYAAITATTFSFFSALFVIIINFYYGNEYVGLWSNTIRIFNALLIFLLGASLPFVLNEIRVKNNTFEKVKTFLFLWLLFCPLIILSFFITSKWGVNILSLFVEYDFEVPSIYLGYIVLVAISISFVGSSQALYQGINKSIILLGFIFISATLGFIFILNFNQSFIALIGLFLISIFTLVIMVLIHLLSLLLLFKTNDLKESNS
tara:strand:- start:456 stop:1634 length:1179 start_codon:yes stop_codon:yes gene_type:complete